MSVYDNYKCEGQLSIFDVFDQDIWSGKTSPEHSAVTKEKTSELSSKKRRGSQIKMPLYLDLRKENGVQVDASWEMGGVLLGVYMMHSFGECPREEKESRLSQILEENPHQKYCLSPKACQGILRRASNRGKELPEILQKALERQAIPSKLGGGRDVDSNGKKAGKGALIQEELSATLGVSQDQTLITGCLNGWDVQSKHVQPEDGKAEALYSGECRGGGGESYVMQKTICIQGNCIDRADTAGCNGKGWREDQAYTLNTIDHHAVCTGFDSYNLTETGDVGRTLTAAGGGPNEHMPTVCQSLEVYHCQTEEEKTQTLKARDYKDPQCVCYGLDRASFNQGKNAKYDFSVEEEKAQTIVSRGPGGVLADNPKIVGSLCASGYSKLGIQEAMNGMYIVEKKNE